MIDIIIPTYNAKQTIFRTLESIAIQKGIDFKDIDVYIVNDNGDDRYSEEVDYFSRFYRIKEIYLDKNVGPGLARQYGIDNSNNPYIMFIDSDDCLFNLYSIYNLVNNMKGNDLLISNFVYERDNEISILSHDQTWLHGKVYRREFLLKNDISFNESRQNEDNGFNSLILLHDLKIKYLDYVTYVYSENPNSITRCNNREYKYTGLEGYGYNINWALDKAIQRKLDTKKISIGCLGFLCSMYFYYLDYMSEFDVSKFLFWSKEIKEKYDKYFDNLDDETIKYYLDIHEKNYNNIDKFISFEEFLERIDLCD